MRLVIRPATSNDSSFSYAVKRAALGDYVAQVWGWDETVQQNYHAADWAAHRPDIVELDDIPIGTLEVVEHHDHLYIGEFYLLPQYQRRGIGTELLRRVLTQADAAAVPVRLQFLKVNPVRSLYERHGFEVAGESATHYFAERAARQHHDHDA
jgi:ribosomal protein S18 acetylase RimI-like enzyme